jgi:hypothetical protein
MPRFWRRPLRAAINKRAHELAHRHSEAGIWMQWLLCRTVLRLQAETKREQEEWAGVVSTMSLADLLRQVDGEAIEAAERGQG